MADSGFLKCSCQRYGGHIEFLVTGVGATVRLFQMFWIQIPISYHLVVTVRSAAVKSEAVEYNFLAGDRNMPDQLRWKIWEH